MKNPFHLRLKALASYLMREYFSVLLRNIFTPIVLIVGVLVFALLFLGEETDAAFLASTITLNSVIAIIQEIRAKRALHKLELLNAITAKKLTNKGVQSIAIQEVEIGDHLEIQAGDQVPCDGILLKSMNCQVNEALLTGESKEISKSEHDHVFAGSSVVAGKAILRVSAAGNQTRVAHMTAKLKWYENRLTPLQQTLSQVIRYLTYLAIIVSAAILIIGHQTQTPFSAIVTTIVAGALSIVPEGLILASTLLLSYGALKMVQQGVLVQRIEAIEGFGRLSILCVDKTGTLTDSELKLHRLHPFPSYTTQQLHRFLAALITAEPNKTPTLEAIEKHLRYKEEITILDQIPFSSSRKWSAALYENKNEKRILALGAPEILGKKAQLTPELQKRIMEFTRQGLRVLLIVDFGQAKDSLEATLHHKGEPAGLAILSNQLRTDIVDSIFYLQAQGISIRVISGDSPETVQYIARETGILHTEKVLTGDELAVMDEATWNAQVPKTAVFARVLPEQKERLIETFRKHGFTGMVGDGVNDALALKQADLSVAMFEGSPASRQVADCILLQNSFTVFPLAIRLGTQIIMGLEMVACIFFNKIMYGLTILLLTLMFGMSYPFLPRHIVLLNLFIVGLPTFLWSFFPPQAARRLDPRFFFKRVLNFAIPNGIITGLAILSGYTLSTLQVIGLYDSAAIRSSAQTSAVYVAIGLGMLSFWLIPHSLHAIDTRALRFWQTLYALTCFIALVFLSRQPGFVEFFNISTLTITQWLSVFIITFLAGWLQVILLKPAPQSTTLPSFPGKTEYAR